MSGTTCSQFDFTQSSPVLTAKSKRAFHDRISTVSPISWRESSPSRSSSPVISQLTLTPAKSPVLKRVRGRCLDSLSQATHIEISSLSPPAPSILNDTIISITESLPSLSESDESSLSVEDVEDDGNVDEPVLSVVPPYTQAVSICSSGESSANLDRSPEPTQHDSSKNRQKRKHYKKGGLALKVVKAIKKRRYERRLKDHHNEHVGPDDTRDTDDTDLVLQVTALKRIFSTVVVECEGRCDAADSERITLVFSEEQWNRGGFVAGCTISIPAPWRPVKTRSGLTIAAPGNAQVIELPRGDRTPQKCDKRNQVLQIWDCPCSSSERRASSAKYCDAQTEIWGLRNITPT